MLTHHYKKSQQMLHAFVAKNQNEEEEAKKGIKNLDQQ
jgi:hypothetical protein